MAKSVASSYLGLTVGKLSRAITLDQLSVRYRIYGGISVVLFLLIVLAAISLRGIGIVSAESEDVRTSASEANVVSDFAAWVGEVHSRVTQYALSESDADQQAALKAIERLELATQAVEKAYGAAGSRAAPNVEYLKKLEVQYRKILTDTIEIIGTRRSQAIEFSRNATELGTIVSAIVTALARDTSNAGALEPAIRLMEGFYASKSTAAYFLASRNPADSNRARVEINAMHRMLMELIARNIEEKRIQRFLNATAEPYDHYVQSIDALVFSTNRMAAATVERQAIADEMSAVAKEIQFSAVQTQIKAVQSMTDAVTWSRRLGVITSSIAVALGIVLAVLIGGSIARPITQITDVMRVLADGKVDISIPHANRHDELGAMASAVTIFRDRTIESVRLTKEKETERRTKIKRAQSLERLNSEFEAKIIALASSLSDAAARLTTSAESMHTTTAQTGQKSSAVMAAAE